jgi:hypothetical protein
MDGKPSIELDGNFYPVIDTFSYAFRGKNGDCGSPLFTVADPALRSRFLGFHVLGNTHYGHSWAAMVYKEDLMEALAFFKKKCEQIESPFPLMDISDENFMSVAQQQSGRHFTTLGAAEHKRSPPTTTKLERSPISPLLPWPTAKIPAKLRPFYDKNGTFIDPYQKALGNYAPPMPPMPELMLFKARDSYIEQLSSLWTIDGTRITRVLSYEEAVLGIDGLEEFPAISRSTSAGYPLNTRTGGYPGKLKGKFAIFGDDVNINIYTPQALEFRRTVEEIVVDAKNGKRSSHIFCDALKDELRTVEKAEEGSTRLFNAGPLALHVCFKMYFGAFDGFFKRTKILNGSAIAVNPYRDDWRKMVDYLCEAAISAKHRNFGAIDHSKFDCRENGFVHLLILDIIERYYYENNGPSLNSNYNSEKTVRKVLWCEVLNSRHVWNNLIYEWDSSLPSGCSLTATINTMYNNIAFKYCHLRAVKNSKYDPNDMRVIALGDDCIFSVSDSISQLLNEFTVPIYMSELGLKSTREDKSEGEEGGHILRPLSECSFLKRNFREEQVVAQRWVAPLSLSTILEMPMWWRKTTTKWEDLSHTTQTALDELSLHGHAVYSKFGPPLIKAHYAVFSSLPKRSTWISSINFVTQECEYGY